MRGWTPRCRRDRHGAGASRASPRPGRSRRSRPVHRRGGGGPRPRPAQCAGARRHCRQHLAHGVSPPAAAVERRRAKSPLERSQGRGMGGRDVRGVHVVANAGAVAGRVVRAENRDGTAQPERRFAGCFHQRLSGPRPGPARRVRAGHVEAAHNDVAESGRAEGLPYRRLACELAGAVGPLRSGGPALRDRALRPGAVDRRARGEYEAPHAAADAGAHEARAHPAIAHRRLRRVVKVGGRMHRGGHAVAGDRAAHRLAVGRVGLDEGDAGGDRAPIARRQVVHRHDRIAGIAQGQHDVAADVAGAPGDQHGARTPFAPCLRLDRHATDLRNDRRRSRRAPSTPLHRPRPAVNARAGAPGARARDAAAGPASPARAAPPDTRE